MIRLTFDGVNDLYQHPRWGAVTVEHAKYLDSLKPKAASVPRKIVQASAELEARNERCIETFGVGLF